jgi:hypothetical protein
MSEQNTPAPTILQPQPGETAVFEPSTGTWKTPSGAVLHPVPTAATIGGSALTPAVQVPPQAQPAPPVSPGPRTTVVKAINLAQELSTAVLGGFTAGLGSFVGLLSVSTATNTKDLEGAAIAGGITFLTFFANSLKNWYAQQS